MNAIATRGVKRIVAVGSMATLLVALAACGGAQNQSGESSGSGSGGIDCSSPMWNLPICATENADFLEGTLADWEESTLVDTADGYSIATYRQHSGSSNRLTLRACKGECVEAGDVYWYEYQCDAEGDAQISTIPFRGVTASTCVATTTTDVMEVAWEESGVHLSVVFDPGSNGSLPPLNEFTAAAAGWEWLPDKAEGML